MLCRSYEGKRKLVITLRELPIEQYTHPIENTKYSLPSNQRQHKIRQQLRPPSKQREEEYPPPPLPKQNILYEYTDSQKIGRRGSNSNSSSTNSSLRSVQKFPQQQKKQIYQQHQKHPIFVESKNQIIKEVEEEKIKNKEIKEKQPQQQPLLEEKEEEEEKTKINTKTITEPEQEVINEQNGFRIRVEAKDFNDSDFRVYIDSYRVLALDGEHVEDNKNGTVTVKKLNRRWKLAEDVDLHSVRAYLAADGNVEISGDKLLNNKEKQCQNIIEEEGEEGEGGEEFGEEEEEKDNQQYMEIKKKNNNNYQIEDSGRKEEEEERIVYQQQQQPLIFNKEEWKTNNGNEIYFK
uniref:SHSP domain-containing protein n=2 Tax=Meloidogyne incognita TaxID=6306 RepID=A0A914MQG0_MELIC